MQRNLPPAAAPPIAGAVGQSLGFDSLHQLRSEMRAAVRSFREVDTVTPAAWGGFGAAGPVDPAPFVYPIADFYRTDPISRASATMAQCSASFGGRADTAPRTGTHG